MKFTYPSGSKPLAGYTIKRGIGIGGFGEVYFATSDAGKELALKRIQRNLDIELRGVTQCLNLKHVNLIGLHDIKYDADGEAWVVMEFIPGPSLKEVVEGKPEGLSIDQVRHWFTGIAAGVAYLHDHGIVHRDLKPGNIFDDNGTVKIGDYGLSKFISCSRRSGQTESVGTFHYMAPEIGKGVYGKEIDIYALGIILHELLTGRVPFDGETSQEIIMKHLTADPDLSAIREPFAGVIRKALAKDPSRRFTNVDEMVRALRAAGGAARPFYETVVLTSCPMPAAPDRTRSGDSGPMIVDGGPGAADADMVFGPLRRHEPAEAGGADPATGPSPCREGGASGGLDEEPIARAFRHGARRGWQRLQTSFDEARNGSITNIVILTLIGLFVVANAGVALPFVLVLGAFYFIYYAIRLLTMDGRDRRGPRVPTRRELQAHAMAECRAKTVRARCAELFGSLLLAALACPALAALAMLAAGRSFNSSLTSVAFFGWISIITTVGVWLLLICGKCWEGEPADPGARRLAMVLVGVATGLVAAGLASYLNIDTADWAESPSFEAPRVTGWYDAEGTPRLPAFLAYFAALFAVPRWWQHADPLRRNRVSLFSACMTVAWAWIVHMLLAFTWPVGIMVSGIMVLSAQFAATWTDWRHAPRRAAA